MLSTFLKSNHSVIRKTSNSMLLSAIKPNLRTHANMVSDSKAGLLDSPGWSPLKCKWVWLCLFHYYRIHHFFFFNWRETALQCFIGFCHTTTQISHNYACITSRLPPSCPSRSSQSTQLSSSCSRATPHQLSVSHVLYGSWLLSPFVRLIPSPTVSTNPFSSLCLRCFFQ